MNLKTARMALSVLAKDMADLPFEGSFDLTADLLVAGQAVQDAHEEGLRRRYARLIESMSLSEAKQILGLPEGPVTTDEISKAYKTLALENHPDRGGDSEKMVDINVARDTLLKSDLSEEGPEDSADAAEKAGLKFMGENFETLKHAWWVPPHNLLLNQTMLGKCNLWVFTILPFFPQKKAYNKTHNGIVIHPTWKPTADEPMWLSEGIAKRIYVASKNSPTIQETVRKELSWIETQFQIRIPEEVEGKLVKTSLATAARRWGVDRLRIKDQLIPLDGSKPRNLGMFD